MVICKVVAAVFNRGLEIEILIHPHTNNGVQLLFERAFAEHVLRDLHGIERGALLYLVAYHPE